MTRRENVVVRWLRSVRRQFVEHAASSCDASHDATHDDAAVDCAEFDIGPAAAALQSASVSAREVAIKIGSWLPSLVKPGAN